MTDTKHQVEATDSEIYDPAEAVNAVQQIIANNPTYILDVGQNTYTVSITQGADNSLVSVRDSRDGQAATARRMARMPDLLSSPQLLVDTLTAETSVASSSATDLIQVAVGDYIPSAEPGKRVSDVHGNEFILAYRADASDRYVPHLLLASIAPDFALKVFVPFLRVAVQEINDSNARVAAHGTHLRTARSDLAKLDRESRSKDAAARDFAESLSISQNFHKSRADMHKRQAEILRRVVLQYASEDSWAGEPDGFKNKLSSSLHGYSLAQAALQDVTVAELG